MGRFADKKTPSKELPLDKRVEKWLFNLKVALTQNKETDKRVIGLFGKRK